MLRKLIVCKNDQRAVWLEFKNIHLMLLKFSINEINHI